MTYATQADMTAAFGEAELIQLTDRAIPPAGTVDVAVLGRALDAADAEMDSYLAARYALPLADIPPVLRDCAADIARYRLHDRGAPKIVEDNYTARIRWLRDVSAGRASLGAATENAIPARAGLPEMTSGGRVFGRENMP